jgi:predicted RNA-binding protein YlxR (DUF448 family)
MQLMPIMRSCIACRKRESVLNKSSELLHLVVENNQVKPDPNHKLQGRGAWLHPQCLEMAINRKAFNRAFRSENLQLEVLKNYLKQNA